MDKVRIGLIGAGIMGQGHLKYFHQIPGLEIAAVSDADKKAMEKVSAEYGVPYFPDYNGLLDSGKVDAVLIATPHYFHPPIAINALKKGIHVLSEKPIAVSKKSAEELNRVYSRLRKKPVFAIMFQMRTEPKYLKIRQMMEEKSLGRLSRITWIITNWFRPQAYYDSGTWRATWRGEGGGVLLNQCPHNLDLWQWWFGMPEYVSARAYPGKWHKIEVEDEVTAILRYKGGATAMFITTTAEAPGTNRLEIAGEYGKIVLEGNDFYWVKNKISSRTFLQTTDAGFGAPETETVKIEPQPAESGHKVITANFVNAILHGEKLIAPGTEGIRSLELGNAMLMSGFKNKEVRIPLDSGEYEKFLSGLIKKSESKK